MKLTKEERHEWYKSILEILHNHDRHICGTVAELYGVQLDEDMRFTNFKEYLPELWNKREDGKNELSPYLWGSQEERIAALKACIEETHP